MFDTQTLNEPVATKQKALVKATVLSAVRNKSFTYTDVLMAPEPVRTMALEAIDGIESTNNIPQPVENPLDVGPVRLVCIKASDSIKINRWGNRNIYGTNVQAPREKVTDILPNDAIVSDAYPERLARNVLRRHGWPIRNLQSHGANEGTVVEWKWLEREAQAPGNRPEITEIYQSILARTAEAAPAAQPNRSKSAGGQPSAHP